jgi:haloacetate dehalogenase
MTKRDFFKHSAAAAAGLVAGRMTSFASTQAPAGTSPFFPGFKTFKVQTSGAIINGVIGGQGPPLLLLHGAPLSHISWRLITPELAKTYTVVAPIFADTATAASPRTNPITRLIPNATWRWIRWK